MHAAHGAAQPATRKPASAGFSLGRPTEVSISLRSGGQDDLLARHAAQVIRTPGVLRPAGVGAEGG
jgi:hypothetical protein